MRWLKHNLYIVTISILFVASIILDNLDPNNIISKIIMTLLTLFAGFHIFKKAFMDLRYKIIGIDLLVTIAVVAAFIIGDLFEAAAVTYLFTLGHVLEKKSLEKTRSALSALIDLKPTLARVIDKNKETMVELNQLKPKDIILVKPGEKIPTDGVIIEGSVMIDEQMMTGESMPVYKEVNDQVFGATLLQSGYIKIEVTKVGNDTRLSKIIHMVEEAQDKKAHTQKFMEVFSKYYTPFVVLFAIIIYGLTLEIRLAITMLVIACPGALVISTPVSFVAGIGNAARKGILFKGGDSIENLSKGNIVFFDKTGTLTLGKPVLSEIKVYDNNQNHLLKIAAIGESFSEHPLSLAIIEAAREKNIDIEDEPTDVEMKIGKGIIFTYNKIKYAIGNKQLLSFEIPQPIEHEIEMMEAQGMTTLIMSDSQKILGLFGIEDGIRNESVKLIRKLKKLGIKQTIMLTGDQKRVAHHISHTLGIDQYYAGLLPEDKASIIESYHKDNHTIFVGDGINDALALSTANASVAVGGMGKDIAMETADVVLLSENIGKLEDAIKISKKVKMNMIQNVVFSLFVVLFLIIGVIFRQVTMSIGMLVHEFSVLVVIVNAIRLLRYNQGGRHDKRSRTKQLHKSSSDLQKS
ncbi:copper-translocating P-type ATPase [Tenericutes bacterium MO-XQ]|nr:copper-translocating P-type ATPase [Tenericutes bacterium MO-XQ]